MTLRPTGRHWAYIGATLGGFVSIAANIAHSYVPPAGAAEGWSPNAGAVIGATFWPVALFVATEILTRVAWPTGKGWQLLRWLGMLPVAVVAALVSYRHLSGLLAFYGEETIVCVLGPVAVDGLMVMATGAILATGQTRTTHTATVSESLSAPAVPDTAVRTAPTLSAVPAVHLAAPTPADPASTDPTSTPEPAAPVTAPVAMGPTPAAVAARVAPSPTTIPLRSTAPRPATTGTRKTRPRTPEPTTTAETLAAPATDPVTAPEPAQLTLPRTVDPGLLRRAEQAARQYRTEHGTPIAPGQLAARLRVNSEQAAQALAVINLDPSHPTDNSTSTTTANGRRVKATH